MVKRSLSLRRVIAADYLAFVCVAYPGMLWVSYVILAGAAAIGRLWGAGQDWLAAAQSAPIFLWLALGLSAGGLPLLVWRVYWLRQVLANGLAVSGRVQQVFFERERGEVEYTYPYGGKVFRRKASLHRTAQTRALKPKGEILVIVDRKRPERAFLGELFLEGGVGMQGDEESAAEAPKGTL